MEKLNGPMFLFLISKSRTSDGIALSKYLKINHGTKDIPIIVISAYPESRNKAKRIGVSDFLQKPFHSIELLHVIEHHINPDR